MFNYVSSNYIFWARVANSSIEEVVAADRAAHKERCGTSVPETVVTDPRAIRDLPRSDGPSLEYQRASKAQLVRRWKQRVMGKRASQLKELTGKKWVNEAALPPAPIIVEFERKQMRSERRPQADTAPVPVDAEAFGLGATTNKFALVRIEASRASRVNAMSQPPDDLQWEGWEEAHRAEMERRADRPKSLLPEYEGDDLDAEADALASAESEADDDGLAEADGSYDDTAELLSIGAEDGIDYTGEENHLFIYITDEEGDRIQVASDGRCPEQYGAEPAYWKTKKGGYERTDMLSIDWAYLNFRAMQEEAAEELVYLRSLKYSAQHAASRAKRRATCMWKLSLLMPLSSFGQGYNKDKLNEERILKRTYPNDFRIDRTLEMVEIQLSSTMRLAKRKVAFHLEHAKMVQPLAVDASFALCLRRFAKSDDAGKLRGLDVMRPMAPVRERQWAQYPGWLQEQLNLVDDEGDRAVIIRQAAKAGSIPGMGKLAYVAHKAAQRKRA